MKGNRKQLDLISDLLNLCSVQKIDIWLMGGWGLDFLLKKETRDHNDVDFILEKKDYSKISILISSFADQIGMDTEEKIKFSKDGIGFDFCFFFKMGDKYYLDLDKDDPYIYPMPKNSFQKESRGKISNIETKTISWDAQYVAKRGYAYCSDVPLRQKDKDDLNIIEGNISYSRNELDKLLPGIEKKKLRLP